MGVDVAEAMTPRPRPAGTAVLSERNQPRRAASQAYSATRIWIATNGQNVGLRRLLTADVRMPVTMPAAGPERTVVRIVPVVSRNSGRPTASTAADNARLMATAK